MIDKERDAVKMLVLMNAIEFLGAGCPPTNDELQIDFVSVMMDVFIVRHNQFYHSVNWNQGPPRKGRSAFLWNIDFLCYCLVQNINSERCCPIRALSFIFENSSGFGPR